MGRIEAEMESGFEFPEGATPIADCSGLIPAWVHHFDLCSKGKIF